MEIIVDNTVFTVTKKYSEDIWQLKSNNGEFINVFYSKEELWKPL